ncbi:hypothetical protein [Komagataeibacter oboediens]|uniref:hypothetical protein n=1 Tax=Komagataeibacter oboediens TaxID=65958 RepID=UPI00200F9832|nr:hypothetical protein [Komagataeibacter oboediens]MCK9820096.1 hypothetical protein [Komagataeibacter oboediens]
MTPVTMGQSGHVTGHVFSGRVIFCDTSHSDMQEWNMLKLKHVMTGALLALIACGPVAHAEPHGGGGGGGFHGGGGGFGGGRGGDGWHGGGRGGGDWRGGGRGGGWRGGGWGWGGWSGGYYPAYVGWGYPWGGWGGWGWGWGGYGMGYGMGAAMGAAAAGASYQAAPEIYNGTGNNAPEDDSVYDKDLSTLLTDQTAPAQQGQPATGQSAPARSVTCPKGQVYNTLTESCDRP